VDTVSYTSLVGLRYPIEVAKEKNGGFRIISGFTRASAFSENFQQVHLGENYKGPKANIDPNKYEAWKLIPAVIHQPASDENELELVLGENLIRSDMNAVDVSDLLIKLKRQYEQRHPESQQGKAKKPKNGKPPETGVFQVPGFVVHIAGILGISKSSVHDYLELANLSDKVKDKIRKGEVTKSKALENYRKPKKAPESREVTTDANSSTGPSATDLSGDHEPSTTKSETNERQNIQAANKFDNDPINKTKKEDSPVNSQIPDINDSEEVRSRRAYDPDAALAAVCHSLAQVSETLRTIEAEGGCGPRFTKLTNRLLAILAELNHLASELKAASVKPLSLIWAIAMASRLARI